MRSAIFNLVVAVFLSLFSCCQLSLFYSLYYILAHPYYSYLFGEWIGWNFPLICTKTSDRFYVQTHEWNDMQHQLRDWGEKNSSLGYVNKNSLHACLVWLVHTHQPTQYIWEPSCDSSRTHTYIHDKNNNKTPSSHNSRNHEFDWRLFWLSHFFPFDPFIVFIFGIIFGFIQIQLITFDKKFRNFKCVVFILFIWCK